MSVLRGETIGPIACRCHEVPRVAARFPTGVIARGGAHGGDAISGRKMELRLRSILEEITTAAENGETRKIILFIDDIHTLVGTGA